MMVVEFGGKRALLQNINKLGSPFRIMSKVNLNVLIEEDIRNKFKAACARQGVCMTDILTHCILEFLSHEEIPNSQSS